MELSNEQQNAVEMCLDNEKVVCVTGGAGTGKTTIQKKVYEEWKKRSKEVILAAPTGRAAKRIHEATGIHAVTLHRLLEFPVPEEVDKSKGKLKFGNPKRNPWNPFKCKVLIIDEASMLNSKVWAWIVDAMPRDGFIRLFGDTNQLPPIDEELPNGQTVFKRHLKYSPAIRLHYNYRSDDLIISNANSVLQGRVPVRNDRFEIYCSTDPLRALKHYATKQYTDTTHQILTAKRKGPSGSLRLAGILRAQWAHTTGNPYLYLDRMNSHEEPITVFEGDKVLWTKNDYVLNVMNGELGIVEEIDDGTIILQLDDQRLVEVPPRLRNRFGGFYDPRTQIDLAYGMTVHKAQGSEFDEIIYYVDRSQTFMLNRNNFYTAITRAKHKVTVIGDKYALNACLKPPRNFR